jgi:hypothetical protein
MDDRAIDLLIRNLGSIMAKTAELSHKLVALEETLKDSQPAIYKEYFRHLERLQRESDSGMHAAISLDTLKELLRLSD